MKKVTETPYRIYLIPLLVLIILWAGLWMIHKELYFNRTERIKVETSIIAQQVKERLESWIASRVAAVYHMRTILVDTLEYRLERYPIEAAGVADHFPGIQALNWIDDKWMIRIVVPEEGNQPALGKDLHEHPNPSVKRAIYEAASSGEMTRTPIIDLLQGGKGFATFLPVYRKDGSLFGFLGGVFRIDDLISFALSEESLQNRFVFTLTEGDGTFYYQSEDIPSTVEISYEVQLPVPIADREWILALNPKPLMIEPNGSNTHTKIIFFGAFLSFVLALSIGILLFNQNKLIRSEERLRSITDDALEHSRVGIVVLDSNFKITWVNRTFVRYLDVTRDALVQKDMREVLEQVLLPKLLGPVNFVESVLISYDEDTFIEDQELELRRDPDGGSRWLEYRSQPITTGLYAGGRIEHIYGITRRKKAEEDAAKSRREWESIFQAIAQPTVVFDINHHLIDVNLSTLQATGKTREDLLGMRCTEFFRDPKADTVSPECFFSDALESGRSQTFQMNLDLLNGWYLVTCTPIYNDAGELEKVIHIATDLSEHRQLEEQVRQGQKMEAIGVLAGGIAHDFNNILLAITGYAEMALSTMDSEGPGRMYLRNVLDASARAASITKQLLTFSRKQVLSLVDLDLNNEVKQVVKMLDRIIGEDVVMAVNLEDAPLTMKGDAGQVQQVLLNLAINAREAMEEGGSLRIETSSVLIKERLSSMPEEINPGPFVMLSVSDTGKGIEDGVMEHIFEPFFTTKDRDRGTGLGLSTVFGIVQQLNGFLEVVSEPGEGTTFRVFFPETEEKTEKVAGDVIEIDVNVGIGRAVLVVEDDPMVRDIVESMLKSLDFKVITASHPPEALELMDMLADTIDLLLSDIVLPEMSGIELYKVLKEKQGDLKVLFMSGYPDAAIPIHTDNPDISNFLKKPFNMQELTRALVKALKG